MRKLFLFLSLLLCFVTPVVPAGAVYSDAVSILFESEDNVPEYKAIAIKTLSKSESLKYSKTNRHEFLGVKRLIDILGNLDNGERKQSLVAYYKYVSDNNVNVIKDKASWYYFIGKKNPNRVYGLYYTTNAVTQTMDAGDLLIIAKIDDDTIDIILVNKDSKKRTDFLNKISANNYKASDTKSSFWTRLWSGHHETVIETELPPSESLKDVQAKDWIRIYFTPGSDCENNIVAEIRKAQKMDIAVYSITNRMIVDEILAANKRGAKIRIITDRTQAKGKGSLASELSAVNIPVVTNTKHKIEHNKFAIFDDKHIVSGSYNWTTNASKYNSENCLFFDQPQKEYTERFEYLWKFYNQK